MWAAGAVPNRYVRILLGIVANGNLRMLNLANVLVHNRQTKQSSNIFKLFMLENNQIGARVERNLCYLEDILIFDLPDNKVPGYGG